MLKQEPTGSLDPDNFENEVAADNAVAEQNAPEVNEFSEKPLAEAELLLAEAPLAEEAKAFEASEELLAKEPKVLAAWSAKLLHGALASPSSVYCVLISDSRKFLIAAGL